jgi:hypothetical protein
MALVAGLPAYVLVKVFQPAFFSREECCRPLSAPASLSDQPVSGKVFTSSSSVPRAALA